MLRLPRDIKSVIPKEDAENRKAGRLLCDGLRCSLGPVLDLSMTGLLVKRRSPPKHADPAAPVVIWIEAPRGDRVFVRVRFARHKRVGFRKHETGYTFVDLSEDKKRALADIARCSVRYEHGLGER